MTDSIHPVGLTCYRNVQPLSANVAKIAWILSSISASTNVPS